MEFLDDASLLSSESDTCRTSEDECRSIHVTRRQNQVFFGVQIELCR